MTNTLNQSLASLVLTTHQVVPVLEKYNLDFCCKGKRLLTDACREQGLDAELISREIEQVLAPENSKMMPFSEMSAEQLIGHILIHHHFYVRQSMPTILGHLEKVAEKHGDRFPYMKEVLSLFREIRTDMTQHMNKEEAVLFPMIKDLEKASQAGPGNSGTIFSVLGPISVMEAEHELAGEILFRIRALTNTYSAPQGACTTFRLCLTELKEFEDDLHQHVHLENNILFPRAQAMRRQTA